MFNSYRVKYSPETHQLLKVLMDEAKMSNMQRRKVKETLDRGEPLPAIPRRRPRPSYVDENLFDLKRNYYFMRRTQDQIRHSGAYERERYRFTQPLVDKEKEKERFGNIMAYGKKGGKAGEKPKKTAAKDQPKEITLEERIDELIVEVQERLIFLDEMTQLGERKRYEDVIKQEIAAKLRELEKLDKGTAQKYADILKRPERFKTNMDEVLSWQN
ncbi:UNVERIFIED_CONTAM: hypothetical protein PYX00_008200 [Menopon gallinae]|uniref:Uncharacterized protein n=1 Tax=Menopon gallinae TaxID=328185 RepID=A0AAW2HMB3_9NEOP